MLRRSETIEQVLDRHERVAFQFSGGKDSTAALLFMQPYWNRMTVYHIDSGDELPEISAMVQRFAALVPRFVMLQGRVRDAHYTFGLPADVVPWTSTYAAHQLNAGVTPLMQDRVACCFRSIMEPLHERMVEDGITLIVRGQKSADSVKGPLSSGDVVNGVEFLYPIEAWTDEDCFDYIRKAEVPLPEYYAQGFTHSADCATCTAWCDDDRAEYLRKHLPVKYAEYRDKMRVIWAAVAPAVARVKKEVAACNKTELTEVRYG